MSTSGYQSATPGGWSWPEDLPSETNERNESTVEDDPQRDEEHTDANPANEGQQSSGQQHERTWRPRTCRICLETVLPTFQQPSTEIPGIFQPRSRVIYESEDGGRLLRPCKCKGTAKYVHEGCLQAWRHADPGYARRNYFQCPTCQYRYRLQRLGWGKWLSSVAAQIALTVFIMLAVVFMLGFIADPIINFALDPYGSLLYSSGVVFDLGMDNPGLYYNTPAVPRRRPTERSSWFEHFTKGVASLGLVSFLKFMFSSPIQFFFRGGQGGGRQGGRERLNTLTWVMILIGVATFLFGVWKGVRNFSKRMLEKAGERVMDVTGDDDNDDDGDAE